MQMRHTRKVSGHVHSKMLVIVNLLRRGEERREERRRGEERRGGER